MAQPTPAKTESRICFGVAYFTDEKDADRFAEIVRAAGHTYNGGFMHGLPCGRDRGLDHDDADLGRMYAVTTR